MDVNDENDDDQILLLQAVFDGHLNEVKFFVGRGIDVETRDCSGLTSLSRAVAYNHLNIIKFLVSAGADVETRNCDGLTPLSIAADNGYLNVVKFLVDHGADVEIVDYNGETPIFLAEGYLDVINFLEVAAQRQRQDAADVGNFTKSAARR